LQAEIIAVGTELLLGDTVNTNASFIARELALLGVNVYHQAVVGDNRERLRQEFLRSWNRSSLIILCGGLGPTEDDLTREVVADALGLPLEENASWLKHLQDLFQRMGRNMPPSNRKQALCPQGGELLFNKRGTAPGIYLQKGEKAVILLPGPPQELEPLFKEQAAERIAEFARSREEKQVICSMILKVVGMGESAVEEKIADLIAAQENPTIATLAGVMEVKIRLTASAPSREKAEKLLAPVATEIKTRLGSYIYTEGERLLEAVVGDLMRNKGWTLSVGESCSGGLLSHRLTNVPGSSDYLRLGVVAYTPEAKKNLLGVDPGQISLHGVVSRPVALAMARGAMKAGGSDIGIGITGFAGPDGGTEENPVGTVYIAVVSREVEYARRFNFWGERERIKERAAVTALNMLRRILLQS